MLTLLQARPKTLGRSVTFRRPAADLESAWHSAASRGLATVDGMDCRDSWRIYASVCSSPGSTRDGTKTTQNHEQLRILQSYIWSIKFIVCLIAKLSICACAVPAWCKALHVHTWKTHTQRADVTFSYIQHTYQCFELGDDGHRFAYVVVGDLDETTVLRLARQARGALLRDPRVLL